MLRTRIVAGVTSGFVMAAVFATVLTVTHFGEAFVEAWRVDPAKPAPVTLRLPRTSVRDRDPRTGALRYESLKVVVAKGSLVSAEPLATLVRVYEHDRRPPRPTRLAAQWLIYFLTILMAAAYMRRASSERAGLLRVQVSLLALSLTVLVVGKAGLLFTPLPPYLLPVALVPLWACLYVDRRTALMLGLVITACGSALVDYDPVTTAVYITATVSATLGYRLRKRAGAMALSGLYAGLAGAVVYVAASEIYEGFDPQAELALELLSGPASALFAGVGAGLVSMLAHPLVSRLFGIVSRSALLNLSDLEQPLLQKMQNEAPGSWEHSRMMANLAEAAAASIQADALLTRVGAYYHDLGKSVQPHYFVENLQPGERSPHEELDPDVSADAIMAHVVEGVRILRDGKIPEAVIEFAYTHHGTSVIEFFWHKCKKAGNPKGLTADAFRYPGMRPRTKETGILMLIDAIEAGARTVEPRTREKFEELVRRVIFSKMKQGQLDECGLSLSDLRIVTARIVDSLCSAYHSRIRYPWQEKQDQDKPDDAVVSETGEQAAQRATGETQTATGKQRSQRKSEVGGEPRRSRTTDEMAARGADDGRTGRLPARTTSTGSHATGSHATRATPAAGVERARLSTPPGAPRADATPTRASSERSDTSGERAATRRSSETKAEPARATSATSTGRATAPGQAHTSGNGHGARASGEDGERASSSQVLPRRTESTPVAAPKPQANGSTARANGAEKRPSDSDRPPAPAATQGDKDRGSVSERS